MKTFISLSFVLLTGLGIAAHADSENVSISCQAKQLGSFAGNSKINIDFGTDGQDKPWTIGVTSDLDGALVDAGNMCGVKIAGDCSQLPIRTFGILTGISQYCGKSKIKNGRGEFQPALNSKIVLDTKLNHGFFHCTAVGTKTHHSFELSDCQPLNK